ncbi:hypothetical protein A2U01_0100230, partial [Trifolium medium]|nr:hypothetical protein [Trifolium medium]
MASNPSLLSSNITTGGGLYLQALRCLSQKKAQRYKNEIEYLALLYRRAFIYPQRWAK